MLVATIVRGQPSGGRRPSVLAPMATAMALVVAMILPASASTTPERCADVSADVGLVFEDAYGATVADGHIGAMMQRNLGSGVAVGDYDGDGDLDVYLLAQHGTSNRLFRNELAESGHATFRDVTVAAGVADVGLGRVAHFADLDGDALLDLLLINDTDPDGELPPSRLFRNRGDGTFEDVTAGSGFAPSGYIVGGASLADLEADGDLDVFITYWTGELGGDPARPSSQGSFPAMNRLFRNEGGMRFVDATSRSGLGGVRLDSFTSIIADFDADADLDIYVAIDHQRDRYYEQMEPLRWSHRSGRVDETHKGNDMGIAAADLGSDGQLDLYLTNITDADGVHGTGSGNVLLEGRLSDDGTIRFVDRAADARVLDTGWGWGTAFLDVDLDADLDLYAVQGMAEFVADTSPALRDATSRLFLGQRDGFRAGAVSGCEVGGDQRALVAFDYDRDGDVDLLMTQVAGPAVLLENRFPRRASIRVDLTAAGSIAAGSVVTVDVGRRRVSQLLLHGGSYLAGPPLEAVFGLRDASKARRVHVRWPDGRETVIRDVPAGAVLRPTP